MQNHPTLACHLLRYIVRAQCCKKKSPNRRHVKKLDLDKKLSIFSMNDLANQLKFEKFVAKRWELFNSTKPNSMTDSNNNIAITQIKSKQRQLITTDNSYPLREKLITVANSYKNHNYISTSRDRPKSAPYPRLKNSKKTSKCQVFFYSTRKSKIFRKFFFEKITY